MRQILAIILSSIILLTSFSKSIIIVNYQINRDYISKTLCENRNKPTVHCNGHCQLKKQLDKQERQEQAPSNPLKEKNEAQVFYQGKSLFCFLTASVEIEKTVLKEKNHSDKHFLSIFHPPQV